MALAEYAPRFAVVTAEAGIVQAQVVEGVAGRFLGHARGCQFPQLVVDEREQIRGGLAVTSRGGIEQHLLKAPVLNLLVTDLI